MSSISTSSNTTGTTLVTPTTGSTSESSSSSPATPSSSSPSSSNTSSSEPPHSSLPETTLPTATDDSRSFLDPVVTSTTFATLTSTVSSIVTGTTTTAIPTTLTTQISLPSNAAPAIQSKPVGGLSSIAVASIGIGAGIGGGTLVLLALGIFFYLYRKRRRTVQPTQTQRWTEDNNATDILSVSTTTVPIPERKISTIDRPTTNPTSIGVELLPPLSDHQLASLLISLKARIKTHVDFFYTTAVDAASPKGGSWDSSFELLLSAIGSEAPLDAGAMDTLLQEPRTRVSAIRMLIAWMILPNIQLDAPLDRTLLPPELVRVIERLDSQQTDDLSLSHSQSRHTTASLLSPIYNAVPTSLSLDLDARDPRRHNIDELTITIHQILQPHARAGLGAPRAKDLASVVSQGAQFGYTLFSQPTPWKLDWGAAEKQSHEIVCFPALVKVGDGRGQKLKREVVICEAEVMRLGMKG